MRRSASDQPPPSALKTDAACRRDLDTALRQSVFRIQTHALGVEHGQEVVDAELEALTGEIGGRARGPSSQIKMTEAFSLLYIGGDRALSFLERGQGRSLVVRERDLGGRIGGEDSLTNAVPFEKWKREPYSKTKPQPSIAPVADAIGLQSGSSSQYQSREELGGCNAGASRRREHGGFGGCHVRPPAQQGDRLSDRERARRRR